MTNTNLEMTKKITLNIDNPGYDVGCLICYMLLKTSIPISLKVESDTGATTDYRLQEIYFSSPDYDNFKYNLLEGFEKWSLRYSEGVMISGTFSSVEVQMKYASFLGSAYEYERKIKNCTGFINKYGYDFI